MARVPNQGRSSRHDEQRDRFLAAGEAARRLGIAPSTLKRWADTGTLHSIRTAGGHRRFAAKDVEQLQLRLSGGASNIRRWAGRVLGDPESAVLAAVLLERERRGSWWRAAQALGDVLAEVGRRWEEGDWSIVEEHVASDRLERALARCGDMLPARPGAPRVLLAAAEGEEHTLGLSLVELSMRERGWRPQWAGRAVPAKEVVRVVQRGGLDAVALSASVVADAEVLARESAQVAPACEKAGVALVAGGAGPWPEPLPYGKLERTFAGLQTWMTSVERGRS